MSLPAVSTAERRARLAARHRLTAGARAHTVAEVADSLVGLHSSDPVTVYLSAAARVREATIEAISAALYDERSVVRHHAMRRTLWVFTPAVARLAHAASTRRLVGPQRATLGKVLVESGVTTDPDAWLDDALTRIRSALRELGEATTRQLGGRVPALRVPLHYATGKPYGGTIAAHTLVLTLLGFMGEIVRGRPTGSWINGQYRWAEARAWIDGGLDAGLDQTAALATMVERYLAAFGPATATDVQWWFGAAKRPIADALARCGARVVALDGGATGFVTADDEPASSSPEPWVALLPSLDPTTMGWKERGWYLADERELFDRNGNAGPTVWVDGRVVGGWAQRPDGEIAVRTFEQPIGAEHRRLLDAEIARLTALVGTTRFTVRFSSPLSKHLAGA